MFCLWCEKLKVVRQIVVKTLQGHLRSGTIEELPANYLGWLFTVLSNGNVAKKFLEKIQLKYFSNWQKTNDRCPNCCCCFWGPKHYRLPSKNMLHWYRNLKRAQSQKQMCWWCGGFYKIAKIVSNHLLLELIIVWSINGHRELKDGQLI